MATNTQVHQKPIRPARPEPDEKLTDKRGRITDKWKRFFETIDKRSVTALTQGDVCDGVTVLVLPSGRKLLASEAGALITNEK